MTTPISIIQMDYQIESVPTMLFFKAGNKWNLAEKGGVVMGYVIHKGDLEIEKLL